MALNLGCRGIWPNQSRVSLYQQNDRRQLNQILVWSVIQRVQRYDGNANRYHKKAFS